MAPVLLAHLLVRALRDGGWRYLWQRLGLGLGGVTTPGCRWIHAASVGEVLTVLPLVEALAEAEPGTAILVTTTTPTGAATLARRAPPNTRHAYLPIDWPGACKRFIRCVRPHSAWIVETEIWPWLFATAAGHRLDVTIVNARLSSRSLQGPARMLRAALQRALRQVTVLARSQSDAQNYRNLGAQSSSVHTLGDLKFADNRPTTAVAPAIELPCCVAASTHDDEEVQLAHLWLAQPEGLLVIAPRHPERGAALADRLNAACRAAGAPDCGRRASGQQPAAGDRLYLADTLGEMQAWFEAASAVFVGGSLVATGGHNVLEPARQGRAIVTGTCTENFREAVALLHEASAIAVVADASEAVAELRRLAANPVLATERGERARTAVAPHANIAALYLQRLLA